MDPIFQTSHAFTMGAQGVPPYTFAAIFGTNKVRLIRSFLSIFCNVLNYVLFGLRGTGWFVIRRL